MNHKKERYCNLLYNILLSDIKKIIGNHTTYSDDLTIIGQQILGDKFNGVFPSDKIPKLTNKSPYAIINLDTSKESGSHWVAIAKEENNDTYIYDSFGRRNKSIIPSLSTSGNGAIKDTDHDAEQKMNQLDCGARSLTWLIFCDNWGIECAKLI